MPRTGRAQVQQLSVVSQGGFVGRTSARNSPCGGSSTQAKTSFHRSAESPALIAMRPSTPDAPIRQQFLSRPRQELSRARVPESIAGLVIQFWSNQSRPRITHQWDGDSDRLIAPDGREIPRVPRIGETRENSLLPAAREAAST